MPKIRVGIERAPDPEFHAELEAWMRDGPPPWCDDRILEVTESVLTRWRWLTPDAQNAQYTYAQPDALLAATAPEHPLGVFTRNPSDFECAPAGPLVTA